MTNLTVIIDQDLKQQAKKKAAEEGLSLSALITQLLKSVVSGHIELRYEVAQMNANEAISGIKSVKKVLDEADLPELSSYEKIALRRISESRVDVDTLCMDLDWPADRASETVVRLQLKGLIKEKGCCFELK